MSLSIPLPEWERSSRLPDARRDRLYHMARSPRLSASISEIECLKAAGRGRRLHALSQSVNRFGLRQRCV
jgi:hypothetical protein